MMCSIWKAISGVASCGMRQYSQRPPARRHTDSRVTAYMLGRVVVEELSGLDEHYDSWYRSGKACVLSARRRCAGKGGVIQTPFSGSGLGVHGQSHAVAGWVRTIGHLDGENGLTMLGAGVISRALRGAVLLDEMAAARCPQRRCLSLGPKGSGSQDCEDLSLDGGSSSSVSGRGLPSR